jgi:hypothetical protein
MASDDYTARIATSGDAARGAVLFGGKDDQDVADPSVMTSIAARRPAARISGGSAAGLWPAWARGQVQCAADLAAAAPSQVGLARLLYREWFTAPVGEPGDVPRHLAGIYRRAHAGSAVRTRYDADVTIVGRHDLIGPDGWWRTWGATWTPPRTRRGSARLILTPRPDRLAELIDTVTTALLDTTIAWSLGCSTLPRRLVRLGGAVLDVADPAELPDGLLVAIAPLLQPVTPPLCLPIAEGVGVAEYPDNGMTFGEHRCHLVALALRRPALGVDPLVAIADTFTAHGIDPARPHRQS